MAHRDVLSIQKMKKFTVPNNLNLRKLWNIIGPVVATGVVGPDYLPISNLLDTNAYEVGYIFVQTAGQKISCFGHSPLIKILGPIKDYIKKNETDKKWLANEFPVVKNFPEHQNFEVVMQHSENKLTFEGKDYYFLSKPEEMILEKNVTIDRASDEDLHYAEWFGMIRNVVVTNVFQIKMESKTSSRVLQVGDGPHAILYNYEMCKIDLKGKTKNTSCTAPNIPWEGLQCECQDGLPLPTF
ncbi:uncharacterized protein LOC117177034 [Belonocnema kinseyi]|uniref:uncharacterized protein LOC117177034 n=1 Tax=Belonocnema kinseyi TaxID=2817044 RepID=UPI00143D9BE6|nr:uncharacterized protein LOC117177034 [Belonocnema kinseyi]